jgi:hypothetical protein
VNFTLLFLRKVGADGVWRQRLRLAESLAPVTISSTSGGETIALRDILVGKTILCSGQSSRGPIMSLRANIYPSVLGNSCFRMCI